MSRHPAKAKPGKTPVVVDADPVREETGPFTSFRCSAQRQFIARTALMFGSLAAFLPSWKRSSGRD